MPNRIKGCVVYYRRSGLVNFLGSVIPIDSLFQLFGELYLPLEVALHGRFIPFNRGG